MMRKSTSLLVAIAILAGSAGPGYTQSQPVPGGPAEETAAPGKTEPVRQLRCRSRSRKGSGSGAGGTLRLWRRNSFRHSEKRRSRRGGRSERRSCR